jgi:glycosyltransferase involved in cell wall biosynthesis
MIDIVIIASNSEKTIKQCLDSVLDFNVILYLNNSTDNTKNIAKKYTNVRIVEGQFEGFGKTKNKAIDYSENDWVFVLDSDEYMEKDLVKEIKGLELNQDAIVYRVNRKNLFMGRRIKHSGWNPDYVVRLFNRKTTRFNSAQVHESVITKYLKIKTLKYSIVHYAINDINDFLIKTDRYSRMKRVKNMKVYPPLFIFFKACFGFFRAYFLRLGILDGYAGLVIAVSEFNGIFFKYMRRYLEHNDLSH